MWSAFGESTVVSYGPCCKHKDQCTVFSGLDPAGPLFEGYDPKVRLDQGDAEYVDVIHSNGESLIVGGFGAWEPMGINLFKISIMLNIKLSTILYNI